MEAAVASAALGERAGPSMPAHGACVHLWVVSRGGAGYGMVGWCLRGVAPWSWAALPNGEAPTLDGGGMRDCMQASDSMCMDERRARATLPVAC